jgi:hypothetical protein
MAQNTYKQKPSSMKEPENHHTSCGATLFVCKNGDNVPLPEGCTLDPSILPDNFSLQQVLAIQDIIKKFLKDNPSGGGGTGGGTGGGGFTKDEIYKLIESYLADHDCECLTAKDVIDIVIKAIKANTSDINVHIMKGIAANPNAVNVQDAFGTHLYYTIP